LGWAKKKKRPKKTKGNNQGQGSEGEDEVKNHEGIPCNAATCLKKCVKKIEKGALKGKFQ